MNMNANMNMRKLLIVDDERHVVDWLYELFSLESGLDIELYKSYTADGALAILAETKIDIVMTDIKMPGMTGLELMEHIYKRWPFCRAIILTGYQNFDYLYQTRHKFPETMYLIKTEDDDVIVNAVKQQLDRIEADIKTLDLQHEHEDRGMMGAQNLLLKNLSDGKVLWRTTPGRPTPRALQERMDELKLGIDISRPILLVAGKLTPTGKRSCYACLFEIQTTVRKYVSHLFRCVQWTEDGEIFYWLLQPHGAPASQSNIRDMFEDVQSALYELLEIESSFVVSEMFELAELPAKAARLPNQLLYGTGVGAVNAAFSAGGAGGAVVFVAGDSVRHSHQAHIAGSIKQYIKSNLGSDLSLTAIADKLYYNPSYISRMFKRAEGVNISDYINAARIDESKKLLLKGGLNINEISATIGYDSPQYFATVFRKLTGITPHQYQLENRPL